MRRRDFARCSAAGLLGVAWSAFASSAQAHTPYNQWRVYRRKHLLIGCHKEDMRTYKQAKRLVGILQEHLPDARARVARAPTAQRLASLMGTDQLDVAILGDEDARNMAAGKNGFEPYGVIALRTLVLLPEHSLVSRSEIPERHAWLVASTLSETSPGDRGSAQSTHEPPVPWHNGAALFRAGQLVPEAD